MFKDTFRGKTFACTHNPKNGVICDECLGVKQDKNLSDMYPINTFSPETQREIIELIESLSKQSRGMLRQLFNEMPPEKTFTAKELGELFEKISPLDPDGIMDEFVKEFKKMILK